MTVSQTIKKQILELENEDLVNRREAIANLTIKKNDDLIHLLIDLLGKNTSVLFKEGACTILGDLEVKEAVDVLINCLSDENNNVKFKAAIALGKIGDDKATKPLILKLKKKGDPILKAEAIFALGQIGNMKSVQPIINAMNSDEDLFVKHRAVKALGKLGSKDAIRSLQSYAGIKRSSRLSFLAHEAIQDIQKNTS